MRTHMYQSLSVQTKESVCSFTRELWGSDRQAWPLLPHTSCVSEPVVFIQWPCSVIQSLPNSGTRIHILKDGSSGSQLVGAFKKSSCCFRWDHAQWKSCSPASKLLSTLGLSFYLSKAPCAFPEIIFFSSFLLNYVYLRASVRAPPASAGTTVLLPWVLPGLPTVSLFLCVSWSCSGWQTVWKSTLFCDGDC